MQLRGQIEREQGGRVAELELENERLKSENKMLRVVKQEDNMLDDDE